MFAGQAIVSLVRTSQLLQGESFRMTHFLPVCVVCMYVIDNDIDSKKKKNARLFGETTMLVDPVKGKNTIMDSSQASLPQDRVFLCYIRQHLSPLD